MSRREVSETRIIATTPETLFDLLADPAAHPVIDGSGSVKAVRDGNPQRLSLDARFGMEMRLGASYKITNKVVEFDEGHQIAWRHFNGHIWRYTFEPDGAATRVTEQWDARPAKNRFGLRLLGFPARNRRGMQATLQRLEAHVTGG